MSVTRLPVKASRSATSKTWDILDSIEIPLRYPWHVVVVFVAVLLAAVAACFLLPKKYMSSTLILVESDRVPESFVQPAATERASKRLATLRQEILSRTRLQRVVKELDPYDSVNKEPMTQIVDRMRDHIEVNVKGDNNDAFVVNYVHSDPYKAMEVANRLTTLFIDEAMRAREEHLADAYEFIDSELESSRRELEVREQALRRYKESHVGTLPEQINANLQTLQVLQAERENVATSLRGAMERLMRLENTPELVAASDGNSELSQLRAQLAALRARYTDVHPDVQALAVGSPAWRAPRPRRAPPQPFPTRWGPPSGLA